MKTSNVSTWLNGKHDEEMIDTVISVGTLRRLRAIVGNSNNVDVDSMNTDTIINAALDWQKKMYDRMHHELNQFQRKIIKGE